MSAGKTIIGRIWSAIRATHFALLVALVGIGWGLSYAIEQEPATGSIRGTVRLADSGATFGDARITLAPVSTGYRRYSIRKTWRRASSSFVIPALKEETY